MRILYARLNTFVPSFWKYILILIGCIGFAVDAYAQPCSGSTPSFTVNLTGKADSIWTSTSVIRDGNCCGTTAPDVCIEFMLTLDSMSSGIRLDIPSGALPGGALFYQIGCGTQYPVGQDICLSGVGPHRITFCKPGNNQNIYQIKAIPKPDVRGKFVINQACIGFLKAIGLDDTSITWQSVPNNPIHNAYLSCTEQCDSVSIIPFGSFPPTVTYRVCGRVTGGCGATYFCDTATVRFVTNIGVSILPKNPTVCFGGTTTSIRANPVGGLAPFRYLWNTGDTSASINVGVGSYRVTMLDSLGCTMVADSVIVTSFSLPIDANAGNDTLLCSKRNVASLRGVVLAASGGKWSGGTGIFVPNDTTLLALYYPSTAETNAGSANLRLVTTGNGTCPADTDFVVIQIRPTPAPVITGPTNVCAFKQSTYSTNSSVGNTYQWSVTGGTIVGANNDTTVTIKWGAAGAGSVSVRQTNSSNCDSLVSRAITIQPTPVPAITGTNPVCGFKQSVYRTNGAVGNTFFWSVTGGTIIGSNTDTSVRISWGNTGGGLVSVRQTNSSNCDSLVSLAVTINPTPVPIINGSDSVCEFKQNVFYTNFIPGNTYQWSVTGGSIIGSNTDTTVRILWAAAGNGSVSVKHTTVDLCDSLLTLPVLIQPSPVPVITGPANVCEFKQSVYSTNTAAGKTYLWSVTGGNIIGSNSDTVVTIKWNAAGVGSVSVRQTNSSGCDSLVSRAITIEPTPVPVISGPATICENKQATYTTPFSAANTYQWTVTGGAFIGSTTDTIVRIKWGSTGTGSVSVRKTNSSNCDSLVSLAVSINLTPVPVINGPTNVCEFKQSTFSTNASAGNTYQWSVTGGTIVGAATDTIVTIKWGAAGAGSISVRQTNSSNCDSLVSRAITIQPTPVPAITGTNPVCGFKQSVYRTNGASGNTFFWSVTGGSIIGSNTDTSVRINWGNTGGGMVNVRQTNSSSCDSLVSLAVTINPTPVPVINGPDSVCELKQNVFYTNFITGNTYQWSVTGGSIVGSATDTIVRIKWGNAGNGSVSVKHTTVDLCDSLLTLPVLIQPLPTPVISGPDTVCLNTAYDFQVSANNMHTYLWTISGGSIVGSADNNLLKARFTGTGNRSVSVSVTNQLGCDSLVSKLVFVKPAPIPLLSGPMAVCVNSDAIYYATKTIGDTYQWTVNNGSIQQILGDTQVSVKWNNADSGMVGLRQINPLGCDSFVSLKVDLIEKPSASISGDTSVCENSTHLYQVPLSPGMSYVWNVAGGVYSQLNNHTISVNWGNSGSGLISLTLTNSFNCDSIITLPVAVKPKPVPVITGLQNLCAYSGAVYTTNTFAGYRYKWTVTGGNIAGSDTLGFVSVNWGGPGVGSITIQQTSANGCDSAVTANITLNNRPIPALSGDTLVCAGTIAYSYKANPSSGGYLYTWNTGTGNILINQGDTQLLVSWPNKGTQQIMLRMTDNTTGCDSLITYKVEVDTLIKPELLANTLKGCVPLEVNFTVGNFTTGYDYRWLFHDLSQSNLLAVKKEYRNAGTFPVRLVATNTGICTDTLNANVIAQFNPVADFDYSPTDKKLYVNEDTIYFINQSTGANQYIWSTLPFQFDTIYETKRLYAEPGTFIIKLWARDSITGCVDSTTRSIKVWLPEELYIPNAFTPNGDGLNEYFSVSVTNIIDFHLIIFDRWGTIMFETDDPDFRWYGDFKGGPAQADVYGYLLTGKGYHGKNFERSGTVTLIR